MTEGELNALVVRFQAADVPRAEWTHQAHLLVGAWHVHHFGAAEALLRLRMGIRRLNEANGVPNTATGGYHETITAAYVRLLEKALADGHGASSFETRVTLLMASALASKDVLFRYYTRELLMSPGARAGWVAPDLLPLP
jgi:hypothetical protein